MFGFSLPPPLVVIGRAVIGCFRPEQRVVIAPERVARERPVALCSHVATSESGKIAPTAQRGGIRPANAG